MSPETFLALVTLGSTAFTFSAGFVAGRAWAAWRVRRLAARPPLAIRPRPVPIPFFSRQTTHEPDQAPLQHP